MAQYDITVIVQDKAQTAAVGKMIENQGGKLVSSREIGQRKFAYPIGKLTEGYYASFVFDLEPAKLTGLQQAISGSEAVVRALILHHRLAKPLPVEPVKETAAPLAELPEEPVKAVEPKPEPAKKALKPASTKPAERKPAKLAKQPTESERLKALDEQLKKLLEE